MHHLFRRILCPVDFSESSILALRTAVDLAVQNQASLLLLNVAPRPLGESDVVPVALDPYPFHEDRARAELERIGREIVDGKAPYDTKVDVGDPATGILTAIPELESDLVVMGTHGRKGLGHLILGSVAERVVRESPVPVLTVRHVATAAVAKPKRSTKTKSRNAT